MISKYWYIFKLIPQNDIMSICIYIYKKDIMSIYWEIGSHMYATVHYDVKSQSFNPGLQYPHLHGPVHTPDNNRWDTPPV